MERYLVSLASDHDSSAVISRALNDCVRDEAELIVIFVARPRASIGVSRKLMESSMLGQAQSRETAHQIKKSMLKLAQHHLEEISEMAAERNISCETNLINGSFDEQTLVAAKEHAVARIYLGSDKGNLLSRMFLKSEVDQVADGAICEVIVVDD